GTVGAAEPAAVLAAVPPAGTGVDRARPAGIGSPGARPWTADAYAGVRPSTIPAIPAGRVGGSGGRVLSLPGAPAPARGLARAAMALDTEAMGRIVARALELEGVIAAWDGLLRPVLAAVGRRWEATGDGIEVEHLLTECVIGALRLHIDNVHRGGGRPVLLACGPGDRHSLPLFAVAAGLAERGVASRMLGPAVPTTALRSAVARTGPAAVLIWAQMRMAADSRGIGMLPATRPPTATVVGGPGWRGVALPARIELVNNLSEAVGALSHPVVGM
ncbi:MAG: B12-binding domain-containing protein, partial [Frankia sp.]